MARYRNAKGCEVCGGATYRKRFYLKRNGRTVCVIVDKCDDCMRQYVRN